MKFITVNFKWLMLVSGALTATMFYGLIAPQAALESMFGASFSGTLESIIVRSWSALIGLIGIVLIYGALVEKHRVFAASIGALSKTIFVLLVIIYGQSYLAKAAPAIIMDILVVAFTITFLAAKRVQRSAV
jgi:hypothetical protein